jgi:hypothetical protein
MAAAPVGAARHGPRPSAMKDSARPVRGSLVSGSGQGATLGPPRRNAPPWPPKAGRLGTEAAPIRMSPNSSAPIPTASALSHLSNSLAGGITNFLVPHRPLADPPA